MKIDWNDDEVLEKMRSWNREKLKQERYDFEKRMGKTIEAYVSDGGNFVGEPLNIKLAEVDFAYRLLYFSGLSQYDTLILPMFVSENRCYRFSELIEEIGKIGYRGDHAKMVSTALKELEEAGVVKKLQNGGTKYCFWPKMVMVFKPYRNLIIKKLKNAPCSEWESMHGLGKPIHSFRLKELDESLKNIEGDYLV